MSDRMRIVCANVHNDSGEVEIIIEEEGEGLLGLSKTIISSVWITKEELFEKGCKFVRKDV